MVVVAIALLAVGCGGKRYDPWLASKQVFRTTVRTLALVTTAVPDDLDDPGPAQALFDSLLSVQLAAAGFDLVPVSVTGDIWGRLVDSVGGYYDPYTGRQDSTRFNPVQRTWLRVLSEVHGAHAVLFPEIVVVDAPVGDWTARWDGTSQSVESWGKALLRVLDAAASGLAGTESAYEGEAPRTAAALSLEVSVENLNGDLWYQHRAGIEVWERPGRKRVPRHELFQDPERNRKAVRQALGSIAAEASGHRDPVSAANRAGSR